ncbi:MAG TPA: BON domain-containing protein [Acidobacteriaceae bacterium]|nr:BON domain-containing protein [Acidobacteriaceae bacterium]
MNVQRFHGVGMAFLAAGLISGGVAVWAQSNSGQGGPATLPDAQIESNVLRALASAPELSSQNIQTSTVYGTVTLTGNVHDEAMRAKAENLAARAQGVQKVVDELALGDTPPAQAGDQAMQGDQSGPPVQPDGSQNMVLQSDGTYAPAQGQAGPPPSDQNMQNGAPPPDEQQMQGQSAPPPASYGAQQGPPDGRQPMGQSYGPPPNGAPIPGGQQAGIAVTVPPGSILRIRINRGLDSNHIQAGAAFDGTVLTDIVAGGQVAIPRGATVSGEVVGAKKAGTFKGQGQLALQIDSLTLGGQVYPLQTEIWAATGQDKTGATVGSTVGTSAFGAILGGIVGGGAGAAIGAGAGAGVGLAGSAATPRGQIMIPPESVLTFRTAAPATVQTVSEREMQRLSYQAGPPQPNGPPQVRYYSPYYGYYYGPPR